MTNRTDSGAPSCRARQSTPEPIMASDVALMAQALTSNRWEIRQIFLSYDRVHREDWGALDVASVKVDGDVIVAFSLGSGDSKRLCCCADILHHQVRQHIVGGAKEKL